MLLLSLPKFGRFERNGVKNAFVGLLSFFKVIGRRFRATGTGVVDAAALYQQNRNWNFLAD